MGALLSFEWVAAVSPSASGGVFPREHLEEEGEVWMTVGYDLDRSPAVVISSSAHPWRHGSPRMGGG